MQAIFIVLFLAFNAALVFSQQVYIETLRTQEYNQPSSKPLTVQYSPYNGIYQLTLKPDFDPNNQDKLEYNDVISYCIPNQRKVQLITKTQVNFTQVFGNQVPIFLDQTVVNAQKVYLVTNNLDIFMVNLNQTNGTIDQSKIANTLFSNDLVNDFLIKGDNSSALNQNVKLTYISSINRVLVISNQRAFHFSADKSSDIVNVSGNVFKPRNQIFNVYERKGYILVAAGKDGIDIYNFTLNSTSNRSDLVFLRNLQKNILSHNANSTTPLNITDLDYITSGSTPSLYVLDSQLGLYDYKITISNPNITSITSAKYYLVVKQYGGLTFDVQNNNLFVIGGFYPSSLNQYYTNYILEVLYSPETQQSTVNRELKEKYQISQVFLTPHYTFVLGQDIHSIFYQGISNWLINSSYLIESSFIQLGLFRVDFMQSFSAQQNYIMGLSRYFLTLFQLDEVDANILCSVENSNKVFTGQYNYSVSLISSICSKKSANTSDTNPMSACYINHKLTVQLTDDTSMLKISQSDLDSQQQRNLAIGLGVGLTFGLIFILIVSLVCYRYYKPKLDKLQQLNLQLQSKKQYEQIEEDPQMASKQKIDFV